MHHVLVCNVSGTFVRSSACISQYLVKEKSSDPARPAGSCVAAFQYSSAHSVLEVSEADHGACSASNPLRSHQGQSTTIPLTKAGTRYFICGAPGHCASGMKVAITVSGGGGGGSSSADNTATPSGPSVRATNTKPASGGATTTDESDSSAAGSGARLAMGLLFGAAGLAAIMG